MCKNEQKETGNMLKEDRKTELLQIIEEMKYITVEDLSAKLYISQSTIRRNLNELEKLGYVKRTHGGVEVNDASYHAPLKLRMKQNHFEKISIARRAAEHIKEDSIVFIDGSSTCLHMVPFLKKKNVTVFTNGIELCSLLAETDIPVYCLGGLLLPKSRALSGELSVSIARTMFFDALFFSCGGFANNTVTDYSQSEACLRRTLMEQSKERYLMCDSSKLGKTYPYIICRRDDLTQIITDMQTEE